MKIDIITFHFVSNCGGVLQCYALQKFLEKYEHEVNVIDYRPEYHAIRYEVFKNPFTYVRYYKKQFKRFHFTKKILLFARTFVRCLYLDLNRNERSVAILFQDFVQRNLKLSKTYKTLEQLRADPPKADAYVTGSDQLWNPDLLNDEFDPAYFLDFGSGNIARISYAVSTGRMLSKEECETLGGLCRGLDAVSIREYNREVIESIGKDVHICIDPTLLLKANDYLRLESTTIEESPYVFVYGFEDNEQLHEVVKIIEDKYKARVINGCPHRIRLQGNVKNIRECGPSEFLTLIKNAQAVVTNSFHGTAFSIIYQKDFITLTHSTRGDRMNELLTKLGLRSRLFGSEEFSAYEPIDWVKVQTKLNELRESSSLFLLSAIGE